MAEQPAAEKLIYSWGWLLNYTAIPLFFGGCIPTCARSYNALEKLLKMRQERINLIIHGPTQTAELSSLAHVNLKRIKRTGRATRTT